MSLLLAKQHPHVGEVAGNGRRGGHGGADKVSPSTRALASLEVAVAGAGGPLAGLESVWIHRQTHAATCLPPLRAGLGENPVQPFVHGLMPYLLATRDDQNANSLGNFPP